MHPNAADCARLLYDVLGCSLLKKGMSDSTGRQMELYPSVHEAHIDEWCGKVGQLCITGIYASLHRNLGNLTPYICVLPGILYYFKRG